MMVSLKRTDFFLIYTDEDKKSKRNYQKTQLQMPEGEGLVQGGNQLIIAIPTSVNK